MNIWKYSFFLTVFVLFWFICADWGASKMQLDNLIKEVNTSIEVCNENFKIIEDAIDNKFNQIGKSIPEHKKWGQ